MTKPKKSTLLKRIDAFLAQRKNTDGGGGWAPVDPNEVHELHDIIDLLLGLKYEADSGGSAPIDVILTDRTRYQRPLHFAILYADRATDEMSVHELNMRAATLYSTLAQSAASSSTRHMDAATRLMSDDTSNQRSVKLGGRTYITLPPAGLTREAAQKKLESVFARHLRAVPCPTDFRGRLEWSDAIAEKASKALDCKVVYRSGNLDTDACTVRARFDIHVFGGSSFCVERSTAEQV
jgi:hypothetical protein